MRLGQNKSSLSIYLSFMNSIPFEILSEERVNELEDYVDLLISSNLSNFPNDNLLVELQKIKKLKFTRIPKPIPFGTSGCVTKKITTIQNYIQLLSYNYLGLIRFITLFR
ncbi:hypothetical protein BC833DRAFT_358778 [Globomyces pollinis-pini]|nr:hypothetical protein BC833DRAFT_358778 [Globomyces pollinis-pini]